MPTYEYSCEACGRTFDYFQSMNDPRLERCILDGCHGKVKRLLGVGAGIIFKGSGFYETDYRSESYKKGEQSASNGDSDAKTKSGDGGASTDSGKAAGTSPGAESTSASSGSGSTSTSSASPSGSKGNESS